MVHHSTLLNEDIKTELNLISTVLLQPICHIYVSCIECVFRRIYKTYPYKKRCSFVLSFVFSPLCLEKNVSKSYNNGIK